MGALTAGSAKSGLTGKVLKALGVFGGVQMINVVCSVIRTKVVAMWLGPVGVGLFGIFITAMELISNIALLGMGTAATREIAAASSEGSKLRIMVVVRKVIIILALLGAGLTIACAPWLSEWAFDSDSHTFDFMLLAVSVFLIPLAGAESGIMQGFKRYTGIARASMWGSVAGLCVSIPMFYFWHLNGVVPSIIAYSASTSIFVFFYRVRVPKPLPSVGWGQSVREASKIIRLGSYMTVSYIVGHLASYGFLAYLNRVADTATVGYFQAGFTLVNRYTGFLFMAMIVEYFPRLSSVSKSRARTQLFVSHEISLILSILAPALAAFIAAGPLLIAVLYTEDFEVILPFLYLGIVGTVFRAISNIMALTILARGDGRMYVITEVMSALVYFGASILCFHLWGIPGMGIAYIVWYVLYAISICAVYYKRYRLKLLPRTIRIAGATLSVAVLCCVSVLLLPQSNIGNVIAALFAIGSGAVMIPKLTRKVKTMS